MRKFIFILLIIPSVLMSQSKYRINVVTKNTIISEDYAEIDKIYKIESILNTNEAYINGTLINAKFENPIELINQFKFKKLVCLKCYSDEYAKQVIKLDSITKHNKLPESFLINKNIDSISFYVDKLIPSKRIPIKTNYGLSFDQNIEITYKMVSKGGDVNLEIKPEEYYMIERISGKFLDIFPLWKRLFDSDAIQEEILKENYQRTVKAKAIIYKNSYYRMVLSNAGNGYWEIRIR